MSHENVEIVRAMFDQFARGDFSWFADVADDFEFVASPELPAAGTYRGVAASLWMTGWLESFEGHPIEATEIVDAGDQVVVAIVQRGRPGGSHAMARGWWAVMTLREGVVARGQVFPNRAQALDAAGLSE
jgi:ketosteroid isomerase-like protein